MDESTAVDLLTLITTDGYWLTIKFPENPVIRIDMRILDRIEVGSLGLLLTTNNFTMELPVESETLRRELLSKGIPYTRSAPIATYEGYEEAKRRLLGPDNSEVLYFGETVVRAGRELLHIGAFRCRIPDVARYASVNALIKLGDKMWLPAGLAMLLVEARVRSQDATLAARIRDYEVRNGLST